MAQEERADQHGERDRSHREPWTPQPGGGQEQGGPQEVELLLDGQRPVMEQRRRVDGREVVRRFEGEAHVGEREAGGKGVVGHPGHIER